VRAVRLFFVLVALPMFLVFPYNTATNNPNENVRTYMTISIVENHTFCIDKVLTNFWWVNDMARVPAKVDPNEVHFYSVKAPATSYVGVPVYWLFSRVIAPKLLGHTYPTEKSSIEERQWWLRETTWTLRLVCIQLPCFLFLIWFEKYLRGITKDTSLRLVAVAAAGLGTNYLAYTMMFASHAPFAIAAFASFGIIEREWRTRRLPEQRRASKAWLAGFWAGFATLLEYHSLPVSFTLAIFAACVFWRPAKLLAMTLGGLVSVAGMTFFQWRAYGTPLTPGHKMVENAQFAAEHHEGVFGIKKPVLEAFGSLSVSPGFGFFGMSPYMWLGLLAIPFGLFFASSRVPHLVRVRRVSTFVWFTAMLSLWTIMSGAIEWRAGWTIGPRYLACAPPFFAFGAVCAIEQLSKNSIMRTLLGGAAGGLALASVLSIGFVGILINSLPPFLITRPFVQFAWPMAIGGYVPHHVAEWFGWNTPTFWWICALALMLAPIVGTFARFEEPIRVGIRAMMFAIGLWAGMIPALSQTRPEEGLGGPIDIRAWAAGWEPAGRDWVTQLRNEAERQGPRGPCAWYRLADKERQLNMEADALRDEARATAPRAACRRF
jgi:hypothetical protein